MGKHLGNGQKNIPNSWQEISGFEAIWANVFREVIVPLPENSPWHLALRVRAQPFRSASRSLWRTLRRFVHGADYNANLLKLQINAMTKLKIFFTYMQNEHLINDRCSL